MASIDFVVFDMDDVFYFYDHDYRLKALSRLTGRSVVEIDRDVWGGGHEERAEAGDPATAEAYLEQFRDLLGYPISEPDWIAIRKQMNVPRPAVLALARAIRPDVDRALLTNNGMMLKKALPLCAPDMIDIFGEKAHVSAEFGFRKPDPNVYRAICRRYGHDPRRTAFIDDKQENVDGACEAGLTAHLYTNADALEVFLSDCGVFTAL